MAEGDILHLIFIDEDGVPVTILLTSDDQGEVLPATPVALPATDVLLDGFTANWQLQANTTGYYINIATDPDMTPHVSTYDHYDVGNVGSLVITGLTSGVTYYYTVSAYNVVGESGESNIMGIALAGSVIGLLKDKDGNDYHTVVIGNLEVIVENLKTATYADGTAIPNLITDFEWIGTPAVINGVKYGYLYNWYVTTDVRNIAPVGWHVPTQAELITLQAFLGGEAIAGGKLKEVGTTHWTTPNTGADNSSGFTAIGSGALDITSTPLSVAININCNILTSDQDGTLTYNIIGLLQNNLDGFFISTSYKNNGGSLRLIKDDSTDPGTMTGNDGRVYTTVKIGTQVWMAENSAETKFRNGDLLTKIFNDLVWVALTTEGYCAYDNIETNAFDITPAISAADGYCWYNNEDPFDPSDPSPDQSMLDYGALYNWFAVSNAHGLAWFSRDGSQETGWVVLTKAQWAAIVATSGGSVIAGGALKEIGNTHWAYPNTGATDQYGFKALPSGARSSVSGVFSNLTIATQLWSSEAWNITFSNNNETAILSDSSSGKGTGFSVRCARLIITGTQYVIYEDNGILFRKGVRSGSYVIDKVNTSSLLRFSGVEDVDWYNIKTITFVVPSAPSLAWDVDSTDVDIDSTSLDIDYS